MHIRRMFWRMAAGAAALTAVLAGTQASAQEIKIGFGMAMTGPLGANGKSALLGMKIWEEDINAKGGLLGKKVKLVYYDDQSTGSTVPGIYAKLLDVDKVDMIVSGYATGMIAPAMTVAIQRKKTFLSLFGTGVNSEFKYDKYFSMIPTGPDPKPSFTKTCRAPAGQCTKSHCFRFRSCSSTIAVHEPRRTRKSSCASSAWYSVERSPGSITERWIPTCSNRPSSGSRRHRFPNPARSTQRASASPALTTNHVSVTPPS